MPDSSRNTGSDDGALSPAAFQAAGSSERDGDAGVQPPGESLRPSADLFRQLVESVRDYAIFGLDRTGHIISWNAGAQRFKGYTADEIIGQHFSIFYPEADKAVDKPARELVIATAEGRFEEEGWRVRKDGSLFWANVVITAIRGAKGEVVGFAKVTRDLTERRATQQRALEAARMAAESEASSRAKSTFLAAMSHELRTPLNAIGGFADLLAMGVAGEVTDKQKQYLERIRASQRHLLAIINDLLNFSRLEAGQVTYDIGPVSVRDAIDNVVAMMEAQANARNLRVEHTVEVAATVLADRAKLEQILLNLLSNAVKFTERDGSIELRADVDGTHASIVVRDTGIGIPAEKLESIFEPFVQVGRSFTSPHEGTGLGLAISRDLARAMDGDLTVESEIGEGSTFTLTLPMATGHQGSTA